LLYTQALRKISRHAIGSLGARAARLAGILARPAAETAGEEVGKVLWLTKGSTWDRRQARAAPARRSYGARRRRPRRLETPTRVRYSLAMRGGGSSGRSYERFQERGFAAEVVGGGGSTAAVTMVGGGAALVCGEGRRLIYS
jgi:hypothetical protein